MSYQQPVQGNTGVKMPQQPFILKEDEKMPLFLIKLWNIVEDPAYYDVIRWDESGYSFHILDPYSFCRNVLPQYFKHNNLNSLIRQLNMYGFRKMTPIERTSLARAESDQDHLEFSHPYFVRDHPELLMNIKRKAPTSRNHSSSDTAGTVQIPTKDLSAVLDELRQLRDRQKCMETKIQDLTKENELIWQEMHHMRGTHIKQQQIVNKLVQFLVALVQPQKRLGKRHLLAIDEFQAKKSRTNDGQGSSRGVGGGGGGGPGNQQIQNAQNNNINEVNRSLNEILDQLLNQFTSQNVENLNLSDGPIIADVTDELEQLAQNTATVPTELLLNAELPRPSTQQPYVQGNLSKFSNDNGAQAPLYVFQNGSRLPYPYNNEVLDTFLDRMMATNGTAHHRNGTTVAHGQNGTSNYQNGYFSPKQPRGKVGMGQVPPHYGQQPQIQYQPQVTQPQVTQQSGPVTHQQQGTLMPNTPQTHQGQSSQKRIFPPQPQQPYENISPIPPQQAPNMPPMTTAAPVQPYVQPGLDGGYHPANDPPLVSSPGPGLGFSPSDFTEYLSNMDQGIDNCRELIGGHWDNLDIDGLLDYDGSSPEDHLCDPANFVGQNGAAPIHHHPSSSGSSVSNNSPPEAYVQPMMQPPPAMQQQPTQKYPIQVSARR